MNTTRPHLFGVLAGVFLAAGLCFASLVVAGAATRIVESQVINVTGSARKNVRSDLVVWRANFSADAETLIEAQQRLQQNHARITEFLQKRGVTEISPAPVQIRELTAKQKRQENSDDDDYITVRVGYRLSQSLEIRSADVLSLPKLAGDTGELLQQNIALISEGFEFIYTKANEAKVEMMADATKDARARAEQIAIQGDRRLKEMRSAKMGVVQINPIYSSATSWEGNNDTTSIDKTITATITATFALK